MHALQRSAHLAELHKLQVVPGCHDELPPQAVQLAERYSLVVILTRVQCQQAELSQLIFQHLQL